MLTPIILLSIIAISILLAIKSEKWWLMAICVVVTGLWAFVGVEAINAAAVIVLHFVLRHSTFFQFAAFILFTAISAALWQNKNERKKAEAERIAKLQKSADEIKVAGFVEDSGLPAVTGWESYLKTLADRLRKSKL